MLACDAVSSILFDLHIAVFRRGRSFWVVSIAKRLSSFFFLVWRFSYLERGWENHLRTCLTRGARVRNEAPWPLFATLWLRLVGNVPLAVWPDRRCFVLFLWESKGCQLPRECLFSFSLKAPFLCWKRLRESKEKLRVRSSVLKRWKKNMIKMEFFCYCSTDANYETCLEIAKVIFRQ